MLKSIINAIILLFLVSIAVFLMLHFSQGNILAYGIRPESMTEALSLSVNKKLGLNQPIYIQYYNWLIDILHGDFGRSYVSGENINALIYRAFLNSFYLNFIAFFFILLFAFIFGTLSAVYADSWLDKICELVSLAFFSMPIFWISLLLIFVFAVEFPIFPSSGVSAIGKSESVANRAYHLVLPVLAVFLAHFGLYLRFIRSCIKQSLSQNFVEAAIARGISFKRLYFHYVLKHASVPIIGYFGANFVGFITASFIIEDVFSYAGLGRLSIQAILSKDYPIVLSVTLLSAVFVILGQLFSQILCKIIVPTGLNT